MTSAPIKLGHIAIGGYGHVHLRTARTLEPYGQCKVVAVADPTIDRQQEIAEALRVSGVTVLSDPLKLLERSDIDAVVVASPIQFHAAQAIAALKAGKHVYLEKPPCPTLGEWAQIVDARASAQRVCNVGFQMQTMPGVTYVKQQMLAGAIGDVKTIWTALACRREDGYYNRAKWSGRMSLDGTPVFDGPATNAISHVVHMSAFLAGSEERAFAKIARVRGSLLRARPIESYDTSYIEAETSTRLSIRLAFTHATTRSDLVALKIHGTAGTITLQWDGRIIIAPMSGDSAPTKILQYGYESHVSSFLDFLRAVRANDPTAVATRIEDTLPYLQMVNGALQSCGGVTSFAPDLVEQVNEGTPQRHYRVKGLDEAFTAFAADPNAIPELFHANDKPWLAASEIKPKLPV